MHGHVEIVKDSRSMINKCLSCKKTECMGTCPDIERKAASNARSATNRRAPKMYTMDGETHTLSYWANLYDLTPGALGLRLKAGYDLKEALSLERNYKPGAPKYTAFGITQTLTEWAKLCGKSKACLQYRIYKGLPLEMAFREAK